MINPSATAKDSKIADFVSAHIIALSSKEKVNEQFTADKLKRILLAINSEGSISVASFTSTVMETYFDLSLYKSKEEKLQIFNMEVVVKAAIIYHQSLLPEYFFDAFSTIEELLGEYPAFVRDEIDCLELQYLLKFRNMMKIALEIIPPKRNKRILLNICSMLEGSGRMYTTGGTQSKATTRRALIFEHEVNKQLSKHQSKRSTHEKTVKRMMKCRCGSEILIRTMWRHRRSKKHLCYLQQEVLLQN